MVICETVMTRTLSELRAAREAAAARGGRVGMVELRLDGLAPDELDVAGALADRTLPVVVTCRASWEGGQFTGSEEARQQVLADAARLGAEFVDVEMEAEQRTPGMMLRLAGIGRGQTRIVVSQHTFTPGIDRRLADRVRVMRATADALGRGSVTKVAVMADRPRDCAALIRAVYPDGLVPNTVAIAMGPAGLVSRMVPARFNTAWTFAGAAAPGQIGVDELIARYRVDDATAATRVFGIGGLPLGHSASPAMHRAAFAAAGIDAVFVPVETADAAELLDLGEAIGFEGFAITAPLKTKVAASSQVHVDSHARALGAINTLRRRPEGGWDGRNFDAAAFRAPLEGDGVVLHGRRAVVRGAGGAARAAVEELRSLGAVVEIAARDRAKGEALAATLGVATSEFPPSGTAAVVVNATPVGTAPRVNESPVPAGVVSAELAYDLVYNPEDTTFLKDARRNGARTIGGLEMLVQQAARQCEWWTGARVDLDVFRRAAQEFIR
jgi:shikimate dehydrogenase/3-dehydroquinate dehydratase type I